MEILKQVKCSNRLPELLVDILVISCGTKRIAYLDGDKKFYECGTNTQIEVEYWYEEIDVELDSEKILPKEERVSLQDALEIYKPTDKAQLYIKALEAAELKNVQLQEELREVKGMLDYTNKLDEELRIKQEKDLKRISEHFKFRNPNEEADERYNKALELFKQTYHVTEQEFIDRYPHINNMFKIAAYGK